MAFDLGVFLTVVGAVHAVAGATVRVARAPSTSRAERQPMDVVPRRAGGGALSMELLVASAIGVLTAVGIYLLLRAPHLPGRSSA